MKSLFLFFLCLLYYINISAQYADSSLTQSSDLLLKAKKQNTVGWILLGGGAGIAAAGLVIGTATIWTNIIEGDDTGTTIGEVMIITGLVSMVSSIPVFIASGKNKKKSATFVFIKLENSSYINQYTMAEKKYPAITLRIDF